MSGIKIISPYYSDGVWIKANLHVHATPASEKTQYSDKTIIREYIKAGYGLISLTENNYIHNIDICDEESSEIVDKINIIPGFKKTGKIPIIVLNAAKYYNTPTATLDEIQEYIDIQNKSGALIFLAQPMMLDKNKDILEYLNRLDGYTGIEILNGNMSVKDNHSRDGNGLPCIATDLWDQLLDSGKRIWGFGNDGLKEWGEFNFAFNLIKARASNNMTPGRILNSIRSGSFVVSTGVRIKDIYVREGDIVLITDNKFENKTYIAYGKKGKILKTCYSKEEAFMYKPNGDEGYVRMQVLYESGKTLLTQPFFIE